MSCIIETDEHHLVLPHLPHLGAGGCLVAFDSHDDLGVPPRLSGDGVAGVRRPLGLGSADTRDAVDIGTWMLAAIYAGRFSTVLWINQWATNLPHADFEAHVGPHSL